MMSARVPVSFSSPQEGLRATVLLNNGVAMPWLGLGVYLVKTDAEIATSIGTAIKLGYRSIDTAAVYGNERGVGNAVRTSGVPRDQLFITTKLWNDDMRSGQAEKAFEKSLQLLGIDHVDLYLLHWPITGHIVESWKALERLHRAGRIRAIGVSNFLIPHLDELMASASVVPAVNQIEFHPYLQNRALVAHCRKLGIAVEAWSPLMQAGTILSEPAIVSIAQRHGKTPAQIILRWDLQHGIITIPKSVNPRRIAENANVFDFELTPEEMAAIDALERNQRVGPDPANFNF